MTETAGVQYQFDAQDAQKAIEALIATINKLTAATDKAGDGEDRLGDKSDKLGQKTSKTTGILAKLNIVKGAMPPVAKAAAAGLALATGAMVAMGAAGAKSLEAWQDQADASGRLRDSLAKTGLQGQALEDQFQRLYNLAGESANKTLFGNEDQERALAKYVQITGDATASSEDLSTILGIASNQKIEAAEASKIYGLAVKGDIGPLKELTGLTLEQEAELGKMTSATKRGAEAQKILKAQFAGVAENADQNKLALKLLGDAQGSLSKSVGKIISDSKVLKIVLTPVTAIFNKLAGLVDENNAKLQAWALGGVATALEWGRTFVLFGGELAKTFSDLWTWVESFGASLDLMWAAAKTGFYSFKGAMLEGLESMSGSLEAMLRQFGNAAMTYNEAIGRSILGVAEGVLDSQAKIRAQIALNNKDIQDAAKDANKAMGEMTQITERGAARSAKIDAGVGFVADQLDQASKNASRGAKNAKASSSADLPGQGKGGKKVLKEAADIQSDEAKAAQETAKAKAQAEEYARRELEILKEGDKYRKAQLQLDLALLKLTNDDKLPAQQRELALYQAQEAHSKALADLDKARITYVNKRVQEEQKALEALAKKRAEEAKKAEEAAKKQTDLYSSYFGSANSTLQQAFSAVENDGVRAFSALGDSIAGVSQQMYLLAQGSKEAPQALVSSLGSAGGAIAQIAGEFGASQRAISAIQSAFYLAEGFGQLSLGNIPGSVAAFSASAIHGSVASGVIKTNGSGSERGSFSGGAASLARTPEDRAQERQKLAQAIADAQVSRQVDRPIVVNFDFSGATTLESSPAVARRITQAVQRDLKSQGLRLGKN